MLKDNLIQSCLDACTKKIKNALLQAKNNQRQWKSNQNTFRLVQMERILVTQPGNHDFRDMEKFLTSRQDENIYEYSQSDPEVCCLSLMWL